MADIRIVSVQVIDTILSIDSSTKHEVIAPYHSRKITGYRKNIEAIEGRLATESDPDTIRNLQGFIDWWRYRIDEHLASLKAHNLELRIIDIECDRPDIPGPTLPQPQGRLCSLAR